MKNNNSPCLQAGAVVFRRRNNKIEILLITTLKKQKWILPKGIIEEDQDIGQTVKNELFEESGVQGNIVSPLLGENRRIKWGRKCIIKYYAVELQKIFTEWPEQEFRKRKWIEMRKALNKVSKPELKKIIINFINWIEQDSNEVTL